MPNRASERQEIPLVGGFGCLELVLYGISFLLCSVSKNRMAVSTDTDFCGGRKAGQECHGLSQLRWGGMLY